MTGVSARPSDKRFCKATVFCARVSLGVVFMVAGLGKIRQPYLFLGEVYGYRLFGAEGSELVALIVPFVELVLALALLGGVLMRSAFLLAASLGMCFVTGQLYVISQGWLARCGCFAPMSSDWIGAASVLRASLVIVIAVIGYFGSKPAFAAPKSDSCSATVLPRVSQAMRSLEAEPTLLARDTYRDYSARWPLM